MIVVINEIKSLKKGKFRPDDWRKKIADFTGFGESYVEKVFYGSRYNKKVAFQIISFFNSEKIKLRSELKLAKIAK